MSRAWLLAVVGFVTACANDGDAVAHRRDALIASLKAEGIRDERVLEAMRIVPRHLFVSPAYREWAWANRPLPIECGQTISQPYIVALMSSLLEPQPTHRVLEVGTGSGYQAAVLARLVKEIWSIELEPELARTSARRLAALGYANVHVKQGDGYRGWPEIAPFDRIILTAAPPEIPAALIEQLQPGGRLIAPVGTDDQWLQVVEKASSGRLKRRSVLPVVFVPMRRGPEPR